MTRIRASFASAALVIAMGAHSAAGAADGVRPNTPGSQHPQQNQQMIPCVGYPKEKAGPVQIGTFGSSWLVYQLQPRDCSYKPVKTCSQVKGGFKPVTDCKPL